MHCSKRTGYLAYLILTFFLLAAYRAGAQSSSEPAPAPAPAPTEEQTLPAQAPLKNPAATTAAERLHDRRAKRRAALVEDTYTHKFEAYGGGGYQRVRVGDTLQRVSEVSWNAGATEYFKAKLGMTLDARGYYGTAYTYTNPYQIFSPSLSQYTFMAGPQYRLIRGPRYSASVRVMAGAVHGNFDTGAGGRGKYLGLYTNGTALALNAALPVDYNVSPALALRIAPDYLFTNYSGFQILTQQPPTFSGSKTSTQHNFGLTAGVVYRFGRR